MSILFSNFLGLKKKCPTDWPYLAGPSARKTVFFFHGLMVHSYYAALASCCQYINYILLELNAINRILS